MSDVTSSRRLVPGDVSRVHVTGIYSGVELRVPGPAIYVLVGNQVARGGEYLILVVGREEFIDDDGNVTLYVMTSEGDVGWARIGLVANTRIFISAID